MKSPSPPPAPDPTAAANAQSAANVDAAVAQSWLNAMNQYGPWGNVVYNQTGSQDVNGKTIPQFSQTTTLSPQQQAQYDLMNELQMGALNMGKDVLGNVQKSVNSPLITPDMFGAESDKIVQALIAKNAPMMEQQKNSLSAKLANQGIVPGSEAYNKEMELFGKQQNSFNLDAILAGSGEQQKLFNMALQSKAQPINEYATLLGLGGQVNTPQGGGFQPGQIANTDVIGPMNTQYQGQMAGWNAKNQSNQNMMGNLFGLGGSLGSAWMMAPATSDCRLKHDINFMDNVDGVNLYSFRYNNDPEKVYTGVIAQEVFHTHPEAVHVVDGFLAVDYSKLPVPFRRIH
jgi:hypothetical protein